MSQYETIRIELAEGVQTITLNRPDALNAFNEAMSVELGAALKTAQRDESIRCVLLTGAGRGFCSGQDLAEIRGRYENDAAARLDFGGHLRSKYNPIISRIRGMEKPVVAAVNGIAAGAGASFAFACDLRLCSKSAAFVMSFVNVGLVPDSGATLTLLQHAGYGRAAELCFLGEKLSAEEAASYGLANRVYDDDQLMPEAEGLCARLAKLPTRGIGLTKRALNKAWTQTVEQQLEYEAFLQSTAGNTADHREGVTAFLEKRKPRFSGR